MAAGEEKVAAAAATTVTGKNNDGGGLKKSYFDVLGICCSSEIPVVENVLKGIEGIKEIKVIVATRTLIVLHDNLLVSQAQIVKALNQARLEANVRTYGDQKVHRKKWPSPHALACGLLLLLSFLKYVNPVFRWVALAAVAAGIWPIALKSFAAVCHLRIDINVLALIAVMGTIVMKDYLEAATIVFLFSISEWLESRAGHKAKAVMSSLLSISPQKAVLADTGEVVGADEVKLGTLLAVKAGEDIPIDGIVVEGKCEVDEKTLTGESFPVPKQKNSSVWAGTINVNGYVTVKTTALAEDCVVAKMAKLVEEAHNNKSRTQRFIDKCAKFYTPAVIIISICVAVIPVALRLPPNNSHWFHLALVVLVSACPCALILSTPVASFCALTKAATSGILIKGGDYLETLGKIKIMAFDKTGTITRGEFMVTEFQALDKENISLDTLLYWVSSIESKSSHPMAAALVEHGRSFSIDPKPENVVDFQNFPGEGVHGRIDGKDIYIGNRKIAARANCTTVPEIKDEERDGRTVGYIFCGTTAAGIFSLSDSCRTGAKEAMDELRSLGIKTAMLTGDSSAAALQAQKELGKALETVRAELLPEDKTRLINDFKREGPTAMIGDGLNDAPALATADIGISMGISGSALAVETGNVILMTNDIRKIPKAIRVARRANIKVIENVILSVTPRIAILGLAFGGHPLVWAAVLADVGACVLVIFNSMLLLRGTDEHKGKKGGKFSATHCSSKHKCCHVSSHSDKHGSHTHGHGCNKDNAPHSSGHHHHHHHHHNENKDCGSLKKTHDGCLPQNCASKCDSGMKNSSTFKKSKLVDSSSKMDDSAGSVEPFGHEHCVHNNQPDEHEYDHHAHFSCTDHHVEDKHCSPQNTQEFCSSQKWASNSCEKIKCTISPASLDGSAGSVELHESGCCTHHSQSAQHDYEIQTPKCDLDDGHLSSPAHHIGNGCCSKNIGQNVSLSHSHPMCHSGTCNSSPCGKTKCVDSIERHHVHESGLELLQDHKHCHIGSLNTSNFVLESQESHRKNCTGPCKSRSMSRCAEDECRESVEMIDDCPEPNGHLKMKQHNCNSHLSLQNEVVHSHCKASNGHNGGGAINDTISIELEADLLNRKPANTCKALENKLTYNSCNSCRRGSSEPKIGKSCAALKRREMGGCCKSYMKECCRKHGDIRMAVRGGLNEIVIE